MKKIFYFAFACALALGGASCSDDSSSEVNEWSAIYVGIERPKLGVSTLTLNINHPTAEVEAKASVPVTVGTVVKRIKLYNELIANVI